MIGDYGLDLASQLRAHYDGHRVLTGRAEQVIEALAAAGLKLAPIDCLQAEGEAETGDSLHADLVAIGEVVARAHAGAVRRWEAGTAPAGSVAVLARLLAQVDYQLATFSASGAEDEAAGGGEG